MNDSLTPRTPQRPLTWEDWVFDLQEHLTDYPQPVYIVGGAVRDAYLRRPIKDLDLVTVFGQGVKLARRIADKLKGDVFVMDSERDVARVFTQTPDGARLQIDVSGFRGEDLLTDLTERDFRLNSMAVDLLGDLHLLIDPLNGEQDLLQKRLRLCAQHSLHTDPIRALRAVRQSVDLGLRIEPETLQAIRDNAPRIIETSGERIRDEFFKLLDSPKVTACLRIAEKVGVLAVIFPPLDRLKQSQINGQDGWQYTLNFTEKLYQVMLTISPKRTDSNASMFDMGMIVMALDRFRKPLQQHLAYTFPNERSVPALLMLGVLLHSLPALEGVSAEALVEDYADLLRLSGEEKQRLLAVLEHYTHAVFNEDYQPLTAHRFWWALREQGVDVILFHLAQFLAYQDKQLHQDAWIKKVDLARYLMNAFFVEYAQIVEPPVLIDGNALMKTLKLSPGRIIGTLITLIREAQVVGEVKTAQDAIALARAYVEKN